MSTPSNRLQAKIAKLYIDMRLKRISKLNWMIESEKAVDALRQLEHTDIVPELFYAHLLLTKEAYEAVEEVMDAAAEWLRGNSQTSPASHAYYLYLTTLLQTEEGYESRVTAKLTELAQKNPSIWQIQWLLFYTDADLAKEPLEQYHFLKKMYISGCRSPLMYIEARALLERNPTFLYEFSEFEVQLMVFMIRHAGMSERVSDMLAEYMLQRTDYRYIYLIILCGCYEVTPSKRILEGICRMMVLGGCRGEKFTSWYRKGIAEKVRVSGLFEAFMKSLPIEEWFLDGEELSDARRIPSEVMEYFAHASALDDMRTAYLYAVVHKYRDNWLSIYRLYETLIQPFMMDQLYRGRINAGLAYLYENVLDFSNIPKEKSEGFLNLCHSAKISKLPAEAGMLQLKYTHCDVVTQESIAKYECVIPVYGSRFTAVSVDYSGNETIVHDVTIVPMMDREKWQKVFAEQRITNILYHMAEVEEALRMKAIETKIPSVKQVLSHEKIVQSFKEEIAEHILPYWDINGAYEEILGAVPFVFTDMGTYSKEKEIAFWKKQYMHNHIGIYGMQFLLDHYEGTLAEHGSIFRKAAGLGIETGIYAEGILRKMLASGQVLPQHTDIFEAYCQGEPDEELVWQYLEFEADVSYRKECKLENFFMEKQAEMTLSGKAFSVIAKLAFLQNMTTAGVGSAGRLQSEAAALYIDELLKQNIYFSWMQPLQVIFPALSEKEAFQVLEYRGEASVPVWVRFSKYTEGKEEADSFQSEVMDEICDGVYTRSFILFYGERMHYEIFGLEGTEHRLLKQGVLKRGQSEQGTSKFARLNQMLALKEKRDNWELYQELEAYYGRSAMVEQLFKLK